MVDIELAMRENLRKLIKNNEKIEVIEPFVSQIKAKLDNAKLILENDQSLANESNDSSNNIHSKEYSNLADVEELSKGFGSFQGEQKQMGESTDPQKQGVRDDIDRIRLNLQNVLNLYKDTKYDEALLVTRSAYLDSYENIEIPLRPIDPDFTLDMEIKFAELRNMIEQRSEYENIVKKIGELQQGLDESERLVSGIGTIAPGIAFSSSFSIIFREGLESALIIGAIITYLEASRNDRFKKHVYYGIILAAGATTVTWIVAEFFIELSGASRELIEAIAGISAVAVLFWVSFWVLNKIETKKWIEFVKSKVWKATTTGSVMVFVLLSFFTVYREGFETVLFYQAMLSYAKHMELFVILGMIIGLAVIIGVAFIVRKLGKKLPLRVLFGLTMGIGAYMSITFLGNAIREFQEVGYITTTHLFGIIPRLDINLATMTGIHPTLETIFAQLILLSVYLVGSTYILVIQPRRKRLIQSSRKSMSDLKE
jgi:high-affinity iron transporter